MSAPSSLPLWRATACLVALLATSTVFGLALQPLSSIAVKTNDVGVQAAQFSTAGHAPVYTDLVTPNAKEDTGIAGVVPIAFSAPRRPFDLNLDGQPNTEEKTPVSEHDSPLAKRTREAVERGLEFLARTQQQNGCWINNAGYKLNYSYMVVKKDAQHPGITAIACLAFMAGGHFPGRGRFGENVRKGLEFVLSCVTDQGAGKTAGFITRDETRMYSHAFATLFLAEIIGMSGLNPADEKRVRDKLALAVHMIVESQNEAGAWRYAPNATDSDMSIAVCQLQALRAARNVGIKVPPTTIERAKSYIRRSYLPNGQFLYQADVEDGSRATWTLTAAGVCALQQAGNYDSFIDNDGRRRTFRDSIDYLTRGQPISRAMAERRPNLDFSFFYGYYYATQAVYQYSREYPEFWPVWLADVRSRFVALQQTDGSWADQIGINYATAMACLILQIHQEYLPIFQK